MIAVDTNVIIRYLVNDDKVQARRAQKLIDKTIDGNHTIFLSTIVLVELVWVLESCYTFSKKAVLEVLTDLIDHPGFTFEHSDCVTLAVNDFRDGKADFSDYMTAEISGKRAGSKLFTFDKKCKEKNLFSRV